jgi:hypothetical protein
VFSIIHEKASECRVKCPYKNTNFKRKRERKTTNIRRFPGLTVGISGNFNKNQVEQLQVFNAANDHKHPSQAVNTLAPLLFLTSLRVTPD